MKRLLSLMAAVLLFSSIGEAKAGIINGGFETGNFTGWTVNAGATFVASNFDGYLPHSGNFFAALGHVGTPLGTLSQVVATTTGQSYTLNMFLGSDGFTPNEFKVEWNGATLYDQVNLPNTQSNPSQYNLLSFTVTGTGSDTLRISERNDPAYLALDDVSLTPNASAVPEPATMTMLGIGVAGLFGFGLRRRRANTEATPA